MRLVLFEISGIPVPPYGVILVILLILLTVGRGLPRPPELGDGAEAGCSVG